MKIIKNIDSHDIEVPYEGITYILPKGKLVKAPDEFVNFVIEKFPLSVSAGGQLQKEKADEIETFKTKIYTNQSVYNSTQDMQISSPRPTPTFGNTNQTYDDLPLSGKSDRDGIEYYGEGVQVE